MPPFSDVVATLFLICAGDPCEPKIGCLPLLSIGSTPVGINLNNSIIKMQRNLIVSKTSWAAMPAILATSASLLTATLANASVVGVENLTQPPSSGGRSVDSQQYVAMSFTTGPGTGWLLDSVTLRASYFGTPPGVFSVSLKNDVVGLPGNLISSLAGPNPSALFPAWADYNYTPGGTVTLAASTTYWITAGGTGANNDTYVWESALAMGETGLPGWTILDGVALSADQGGSWGVDSTLAPVMFSINVSAVPVPEPGQIAAMMLTGIGVGGYALHRFRQRTQV